MRVRILLMAALVAVSACTAPMEPASSEAAADQSDFPRTPSGRPDLNGIWQAMGNAHWNIEPHMASAALATIPGPVGPVPASEVLSFGAVGAIPSGLGIVDGGEIPYLPEARVKQIENKENWLERDPEIKCYLPGIPRATYMQFPFQIFQSDSKFFMAYEYASALRDVYFEDPGPAQVDSWMGQSVGRWEGDTLVVEVTGLHDGTWFDRAGKYGISNHIWRVPHSPQFPGPSAPYRQARFSRSAQLVPFRPASALLTVARFHTCLKRG